MLYIVCDDRLTLALGHIQVSCGLNWTPYLPPSTWFIPSNGLHLSSPSTLELIWYSTIEAWWNWPHFLAKITSMPTLIPEGGVRGISYVFLRVVGSLVLFLAIVASTCGVVAIGGANDKLMM